jgi:hypothetical protein
MFSGNSAVQAIELLIRKGVPESHIFFLNLISVSSLRLLNVMKLLAEFSFCTYDSSVFYSLIVIYWYSCTSKAMIAP